MGASRGEGLAMAIHRLNACLPLLLTESFADAEALVAHYLPFMRLHGEHADRTDASEALAAEVAAKRPDLAELIARHNSDDLELYSFGKARFRSLVRRVRSIH